MTDDLTAAVTAIDAAAPAYEKAESMYCGEVDEVFASTRIKRILNDSSTEYRINLARRVVDAVLDRVRILTISIPDNPDGTRRLIEEFWTPNRVARLVKQVHRGALKFGDAYLFVWDGETDNSARAYYNSPLGVRAFYDVDNPSEMSYVAKKWETGQGKDKRTRANLYYRDRIERYISREGARGDKSEDFEQLPDEAGAWPIPNPYDQIPVFHFRTDDPYGRPEHYDAYGPQNAINKLVATHMSSADFQGFPQRWRLRNVTTTDLAGFMDNDEVEGEPDDVSDLQAGPGTVWDLNDTKAVGQFDAADPEAFLKPLNFYARAMSATTATPLRFLEPSGNHPSGESLRADDAPLSEKIGDRQTWFNDEWHSFFVFVLQIMNIAGRTVDIQWKPTQIVQDAEGWKTLQAKLEAGVPFKVVMREAGYDPQLVDQWDRDRIANQS